MIVTVAALSYLAQRLRDPQRRGLPPQVLDDARHLAFALGGVFDAVEPSIKAGVTTRQIDQRVREELKHRNLLSGFLGYHGYEHVSITSVNEVAANGVPSDRVLQSGDLLKLEIGVRGDHSHAIQGWTYPIGPVRDQDRRLIESAREALRLAIAAVRPQARAGDIGWAIQSTIENAGFNVNRAFLGFGMGREAHEDPPLPGYGDPGRGARLYPGRVYSIYVIAHAGEPDITGGPSNNAAVDGKRVVTFSRMVALTEGGGERLSPERP